MLGLPLRRLTRTAALFAAALAGSACEEPSEGVEPVDAEESLGRGADYVSSPEARRRALEESVVNPDNDYSRRRLERYREEEWGALPLWNPRTRPVTVEDLGRGAPEPDGSWEPLEADSVQWTEEALSALGEEVFRRYPMQVEPALRAALADEEGPERYGLWQSEGLVGGLVWVDLPGGVEPALTCASCHGSSDGAGGVVLGLGNGALDRGRMMDEFRGMVSANGRWGPGRIDVTDDDIENPTAIPDLRAVRFQESLNRAATLRNDLIALAVRLETGMIVATGEVVRPSRELVFAMTLYLWSLGERLPEPGVGPGREVYDRECASCHVSPSLAGPPVPLAEVGTSTAIGESPVRTTGCYQTTSLRGLGDRALLLSDGAVSSLPSLLDADRDAPGHLYGVDLAPEERAALLDFLAAL